MGINEKRQSPLSSKPLHCCHQLSNGFYCFIFAIFLSLEIFLSLHFESFRFISQSPAKCNDSNQPTETESLWSVSLPVSPPLLPPPPHPPLPPLTFPNMSDEELLLKATMFSKSHDISNYKIVPKVAFLFLAGGDLPLALIWEKFFKGHEGFYSIYVHSDPSFNDSSVPTTSVFSGRRIHSQPVYWGTSTMVAAERRLLANALFDISNQRFVLLSETCIPLFNFKTVYDYLMNSSLSFLSSFDDPRGAGRGRYNRTMAPEINITNWRKGHQWFELHRDLAVQVVADQKYYPIFVKKCLPGCYMDEHYIPTLVHMLYPELNSNRTVTWVDWSKHGPHPRKFGWKGISDEFLKLIRFGQPECTYNGNTTSMCYLFARKFAENTVEPLLRVVPPLLGGD